MGNATQQTSSRSPQLYRLRHLKAKLGISGSHIWALVKQNRFPKPIKISPNCTAWTAESIEQWLQSRIAESK